MNGTQPGLPGVDFREATEHDFAAMAHLRALRSATAEHWLDRIEKYSRGEVNPQQALPPRVMYVAVHAGKVVGFVAAHLTRRFECDGEVQWIDTDEAYRRKGIATELLRTASRWFESKYALKVCVDPGNESARQFYARNGAQNLNDHWLYWEDIRTLGGGGH